MSVGLVGFLVLVNIKQRKRKYHLYVYLFFKRFFVGYGNQAIVFFKTQSIFFS